MTILKTYLNNTGMKQGSLADKIGISRSYMSEIVSGQRVPSLAMAGRIAAATGGNVPVSSWLDAPGHSASEVSA